jgi:signal transduction histidine kinase
LTLRSAEQRLVRRVLLWGLGFATVAAPSTFGRAPIDVPDLWVWTYSVVQAGLFVWLWRREGALQAVATGAIASAALVSSAVWVGTLDAVAAGSVPADAAGNVLLQAVAAISGVAFVTLPVRPAAVVSFGYLASFPLVALGRLGTHGWDLLGTRGIDFSLRYATVATGLFLVVALIATRRGAERDRVRDDHDLVVARSRQRQQLQEQAAHELRNPLTVLQASVHLLAARGEALDARSRDEILAVAKRAVGRLAERVDGITRSDAIRRKGAAGPVELTGIVTELLADLAPLIGNRPVAFALAESISVHADRQAIEQTLENLLSNALKYSPPGSGLDIASTIRGSTAELTVTDHGGGLTPAEATEIFQPRVRAASTAERADGSGLGLAVVHQLVSEWGGQVWCTPQPAMTTFHITFPLQAREVLPDVATG